MRFCPLASAFVIFSLSLLAHADTLTAFDLNANLQSGGTLTGTISFDITTGNVITYDLVSSEGGTKRNFTSNNLPATRKYYGGYYLIQFADNPATLDLYLPVTTLVNYAGGNICTTTTPQPCQATELLTDHYGNNLFATSGSLSPAPAPTPEPSSLVLLGTGLLGMVGMARKELACKSRKTAVTH